MTSAVLLLSCPDQRGIVAATADFVLAHGGNVINAEQHVDTEAGVFFQRVEFDLDGASLAREEVEPAFAQVARRFDMEVTVRFSDERPRVAVLASKQQHCLADLLSRARAHELPGTIAAVISNHSDHEALAHFSGAPFYYLPLTRQTKAEQEHQVLDVLRTADVELVVLARYMQVLSPTLLNAYPRQIINIHHSFLPAFVGAKPYHQAQERGVKLIGATAHYATADLDEGPIIAQDVAPVSHRDSVEDMVRKGRDLETVVLARAVRAHLEHRTLVFGNKTIVFS